MSEVKYFNPTVQLYRCNTCGKFSTAKKQPKNHQRWVSNPADDISGGGFVTCGPFVPYVASPGRC